jgi:flagellar protein FliL
MAKEEAAAETPPPRKSKKLLIIIIAVLILAIAGGAAAFLLLGGKSKKGHDKQEVVHEDAGHAQTILVPFEEKFTVNIQSEDGSAHYLQVPKVELEVASEEVAKNVEMLKSKLSDRISSLLRKKTMAEMLEPGSDVKLKEELKKVVNETLNVSPGDVAKKGVKEVILPASFIVQ